MQENVLEKMKTLLRNEDYAFIREKAASMRLTHTQIRLLCEQASDLRLWKEKPLSFFWPGEEEMAGLHDKSASKAALAHTVNKIDELRRMPTDYGTFTPDKAVMTREKAVIEQEENIKLFGRCPCPPEAEILRCCNLKTLDAVQQCTFACAYCSIQSFYCDNEVRFIGNLKERLLNLELEPSVWHLGTGQSSDSLLYGDSYGTLSALSAFAKKNPNVVVELKTKSRRTDWLGKVDIPSNILATWSLNAPTIAEKEELLTASLDERLAAARKVADAGIKVGFHFHPMVLFKGWEEEYADAVKKVVSLFTPEEVVTVSIGTLTFPKAVINRLRTSSRASRILQMPLTPIAGKFSYPLEIKKTMFKTLYSQFPETWKKNVFFYLCMEDPALWNEVFGYEYSCNKEFEHAMRSAYYAKLGITH